MKGKNKWANFIIIVLSIMVAGLVSYLTRYSFGSAESVPWDVTQQPMLHAILNSITALLLIIGYVAVRNGEVKLHRFAMFMALMCSGLFLLSYVSYHALTESTAFGGVGGVKYLYYFILVSHILLAALIFPLVLITVHRALTGQIEAHKRLARITFPLWLYVAISGVVVYLMIAPYY